MSQVVQITLKANDEASSAVGAVSDRFERLKALVDDFPSALRSTETGFSTLQPQLDSVSHSLSVQERLWRSNTGATEQAVRDVESYGRAAADSFLDVEWSMEQMTGKVRTEAAVQQDAWQVMTGDLMDMFDHAFRGIVSGSGEMGDSLVTMLGDIMGRMADVAAASPIVIPVSASLGASSASSFGSSAIGRSGGTGLNLFGGGSFLTSSALWGSSAGFDAATGLEATSSGLLGSGGAPAFLTAAAPWIGPLALAAGIGIPLLSKLFEDRPQPKFDTRGYVPGTFQGFVGANPSDLLGITNMNADAEESAGQDQAAIQATYDAVTGGLQSTFRSIYQILPDSVADAWDRVSTDGWENVMNSTRATVGLAVEGHLKLWLSGFSMYMGQSLLQATASTFGEQAGYNDDQITALSQRWKDLVQSWVDPLVSTMDPAEFAAAYEALMTKFMTGVSGIMNYAGADLMGDYQKSLTAGTYENQAAAIDTQIKFITDSLSELAGDEYANALNSISDLLKSRYEMEITYLGQLKTLQDGLLTSMNDQISGFQWDVMSPEERYSKLAGDRQSSWETIMATTDPQAMANAVQQYIESTGQLWSQGQAVYGDAWQSQNLGSFEGAKDIIEDRVTGVLGETIDQLLSEHGSVAGGLTEALKPDQDAIDQHSAALKTAASNVQDFSGAIAGAIAALQNAASTMDAQTAASAQALAAQLAVLSAARAGSDLAY